MEEWSIERIVPGGEGFCRLPDGRVGFVPGGAPGDRIAVRRYEERRGFVRAAEWELVQAGPNRITPPCPLAPRPDPLTRAHCGGCDWMHLSRDAQSNAKRDIVAEALRRTAKLQEPPVAQKVVTSGPALGYRNHVRVHVSESGVVGFHQRGSHEVIAVADCPVCRAPLNDALAWLSAMPPSLARELREVDLREDLGGGPSLVRCVPRNGTLSNNAVKWLESGSSRFTIELTGGRSSTTQRWPLPGAPIRLPSAKAPQKTHPQHNEVTSSAAPTLHGLPDRSRSSTLRGNQDDCRSSDLYLIVHGDSFAQVNWFVNHVLIDHVVDLAKCCAPARFCEVYCGSGNFTLPLLAAGLHGVGIERDPRAIRGAKAAGQAAGLEVAGFIAGDAARVIRRMIREGQRFDLVLLDPPRAGAREVTELIPKLGAQRILMCSCDPVTLARDTKHLLEVGYDLQQVTVFDMFPQTHHLESLALFERSSSAEQSSR